MTVFFGFDPCVTIYYEILFRKSELLKERTLRSISVKRVLTDDFFHNDFLTTRQMSGFVFYSALITSL